MGKKIEFKELFILELANNHCGSLEHGLEIIRQTAKICRKFNFRFAYKLQYRSLDTFIHPDYRGNKEIKFVRRFEETRLTQAQLKALKDQISRLGFPAICTPFDEASVELVKKHAFDAVKIASCSFTDWPLLEKIAALDLPVIASTAGASLEEIDQVSTFLQHRNKQFCLLHCVGRYPAPKDALWLNQIDLLKQRYPEITIGYSGHEEPQNTDAVKIAIAKGAQVFERHVSVPSQKYPVNAYSLLPPELENWLNAAQDALRIQGKVYRRYLPPAKEKEELRSLKRGVFCASALGKGEKLGGKNIFLAIPAKPGQLLANDLSKYVEYTLKKSLKNKAPVEYRDVQVKNLRGEVLKIVKELKKIILKSGIALPEKIDLELSHHYGIQRYRQWGAAILKCINREYCKKLIILLPGQKHPLHYHLKKEETFQVLYGAMKVTLGKQSRMLKAGDILVVERGKKHDFSSQAGVIFEEVSTTHYAEDSFYDDKAITKNAQRKTELTFRLDWLSETIR